MSSPRSTHSESDEEISPLLQPSPSPSPPSHFPPTIASPAPSSFGHSHGSGSGSGSDRLPPSGSIPAHLTSASSVAKFGGSVYHHSEPDSRNIQSLTGVRFKNETRTNLLDDFIYWSLIVSWFRFFLTFVGIWLLLSGVFLLAFLPDQGSITPRVDNWGRFYLMNMMTLAGSSIGRYTFTSTYLDILMALQCVVKVGYGAMLSGFIIARFTRPITNIRFSNCCCVSASPAHDNQLMLQFKVMHMRKETLTNVNVEACLAVTEQFHSGTHKGAWRGFHDLELVRKSLPNFALPWTVFHVVDAESKLYEFHQASSEALIKANATIYVTFTALDTVFGRPINARHEYCARDILFDRRFVDTVRRVDGVLEMDLSLLDVTEPSEVTCTV